MVLVQPAEFRIDLEVAYQAFVIFVEFVRQNPADMRPPESSADWRVDVVFIVRVTMVVSMMRRPPQDALLRAGLREKRHQKLEGAAELVRTMTEITVVAGSRAERAKKISGGQKDDVLPSERNKE